MSEPTIRVRALFHCDRHEEHANPGGQVKVLHSYHFTPVKAGDDVPGLEPATPARFWEYTPGGSLELNCINGDLFETGRHYFIDVTPVPAPE